MEAVQGVIARRPPRRTLERWALERPMLEWMRPGIAGAMVILAAAAVGCGLPYWRGHLWAGLLTVCCCAGLGAAGMRSRTEGRARQGGLMLLITGVAWAATWSQSWNSGPFPLIGQFAQAIAFLAVGISILQHVHPGRLGRLAWCWIAAAVVVLVGGTAVSVAISSPARMGYAPGVYWTPYDVGAGDFSRAVSVLGKVYVLLAAAYCAVFFHQIRSKLPRKYMRLSWPLQAFIALGALAVGYAEQGSALTNLGASLQASAFQSLIGAAFLAMLLYVDLQRSLRVGILAAASAERRRIAELVHDGAQGGLYALYVRMEAAALSTDDVATRARIVKWQRCLQDSMDELRDLSHGIYPATLSQHGVRAALESLAEREAVLSVHLDVPEGRFTAEVEENLYFAAHEILTNAAKHSAAAEVRIEVRHAPPWLVCRVSDDGNGRAAIREGHGLDQIVRNRVHPLGGTFTMHSAPGAGTTIEMRWPCE